MRYRAFFVVSVVVLLFCTGSGLSLNAQQSNGPFGLHRGMTKAEVLAAVGRNAVSKEKSDVLGGSMIAVTTVPKPYREFESYLLFFSQRDGLLKIIAIGSDIHTSEEGTELRGHYSELKQLLIVAYSYPRELDAIKANADESLSEPRFFMLSLLQDERNLFCLWPSDEKSALKDNISGIVLEAKASQLNTGYLKLTYEFTGWNEYVDRLKSTEGSVL